MELWRCFGCCWCAVWLIRYMCVCRLAGGCLSTHPVLGSADRILCIPHKCVCGVPWTGVCMRPSATAAAVAAAGGCGVSPRLCCTAFVAVHSLCPHLLFSRCVGRCLPREAAAAAAAAIFLLCQGLAGRCAADVAPPYVGTWCTPHCCAWRVAPTQPPTHPLIARGLVGRSAPRVVEPQGLPVPEV